tara:strand:- start:1327 stop:1692 length:366 start_codon:yes stop_codon:yes gene_type:complete
MSLLWVKFVGWCKERWELLVGFFLGIFALLALFKRSDKKVLQEKSKMNDKVQEAEIVAREKLEVKYQENLQSFLDKNEKIQEETKEKIKSLDGEKKDRVRELLDSNDPEAAVAAALRELLK